MNKNQHHAFPDPFLMGLDESSPDQFIDQVIDLCEAPGDKIQDRPEAPETVVDALPPLSKMIEKARRRLKRVWVRKSDIRDEMPDHVTDDDFEAYWGSRKQGNRYHRAYEFGHDGEQEIVAVGRRKSQGEEQSTPPPDRKTVDDVLREFKDAPELDSLDAAFQNPVMENFMAGFERQVDGDFIHPDDLVPESSSSRAAVMRDGGMVFENNDYFEDLPVVLGTPDMPSASGVARKGYADEFHARLKKELGQEDEGKSDRMQNPFLTDTNVKRKGDLSKKYDGVRCTPDGKPATIHKIDDKEGIIQDKNETFPMSWEEIKTTMEKHDGKFVRNGRLRESTINERAMAINHINDPGKSYDYIPHDPNNLENGVIGRLSNGTDIAVASVHGGEIDWGDYDDQDVHPKVRHQIELELKKMKVLDDRPNRLREGLAIEKMWKFLVKDHPISDFKTQNAVMNWALPFFKKYDHSARIALAGQDNEHIMSDGSFEKKIKSELENQDCDVTEKDNVYKVVVPKELIGLREDCLNEDLTMSDGDKKVLMAFLDQKAASSKKFDTDGEQLDGSWMGGKNIARWKNGKIHLRGASSRSEQTVHRFLTKNGAKNDFAKDRLLREGRHYKDNEWPQFFVSMEGESSEYPRWEKPDNDGMTPELKREARTFTDAVHKTLDKYFKDNPEELADGHSINELKGDNFISDVLLTLEGHGAGIWDGDWDVFFAGGNSGVEKLQKFLEHELRTAHDKIMDAIRDAAYETMGGEETNRLRESLVINEAAGVTPEVRSLFEKIHKSNPKLLSARRETYEGLKKWYPGAGGPRDNGSTSEFDNYHLTSSKILRTLDDLSSIVFAQAEKRKGVFTEAELDAAVQKLLKKQKLIHNEGAIYGSFMEYIKLLVPALKREFENRQALRESLDDPNSLRLAGAWVIFKVNNYKEKEDVKKRLLDASLKQSSDFNVWSDPRSDEYTFRFIGTRRRPVIQRIIDGLKKDFIVKNVIFNEAAPEFGSKVQQNSELFALSKASEGTLLVTLTKEFRALAQKATNDKQAIAKATRKFATLALDAIESLDVTHSEEEMDKNLCNLVFDTVGEAGRMLAMSAGADKAFGSSVVKSYEELFHDTYGTRNDPKKMYLEKIIGKYITDEDTLPPDVFTEKNLTEAVLEAMSQVYLGGTLDEVSGKPLAKKRDWLGWGEAVKSMENLRKTVNDSDNPEDWRRAALRFELPEGIWGSGNVVANKMDPLLDRIVVTAKSMKIPGGAKTSLVEIKHDILMALDALLKKAKEFADRPELVTVEDTGVIGITEPVTIRLAIASYEKVMTKYGYRPAVSLPLAFDGIFAVGKVNYQVRFNLFINGFDSKKPEGPAGGPLYMVDVASPGNDSLWQSSFSQRMYGYNGYKQKWDTQGGYQLSPEERKDMKKLEAFAAKLDKELAASIDLGEGTLARRQRLIDEAAGNSQETQQARALRERMAGKKTSVLDYLER